MPCLTFSIQSQKRCKKRRLAWKQLLHFIPKMRVSAAPDSPYTPIKKRTRTCKLTGPYVANIIPPARGQDTHYDMLGECFGAHVGYGGAKTWIVQRPR